MILGYLLGPGSGSGVGPRCPDPDPTKKLRIRIRNTAADHTYAILCNSANTLTRQIIYAQNKNKMCLNSKQNNCSLTMLKLEFLKS
jgi:hypothetical protein